MRLLNLCVFATMFSKSGALLMPTKKICKDCRHFIGNNMECRKFGVTNLVTGKVTYDAAWLARSEEKKCGKEAIHFEENQFKIITVPYYFFKSNVYIWLIVTSAGSYLYALFHAVSHK
jgi:carbon starvation protein CstA